MAYDFVGKKIATSMNGAKNSRVYTQTLLGQTIDENPVPEWTADPANDPFVTFQNPKNGLLTKAEIQQEYALLEKEIDSYSEEDNSIETLIEIRKRLNKKRQDLTKE